VIRLGGATEVEVKARRDRFDEALRATRAAVEEGILPGGGVSLLRAAKTLDDVKTENDDERYGMLRRQDGTPAALCGLGHARASGEAVGSGP
jgi:chaperonin GroEL